MIVKRILYVLFFIFVITDAFAQRKENGIGLRFGEPLGITYKRYLPKNKAWEFLLATAPKGWGYFYYKESFERREENEDYTFKSQDVSNVIYLEARYIFQYQIPVEDMKGTLEWYWGVGGLFKTAKVEYSYIETAPPNVWHTDERTDIDIGPEGIIGAEYTFEDVPITFFGEFNLLWELVDRPTFRLLGGTGVRFNF